MADERSESRANSKELGGGSTSTFALANRPRATRAMVAKVRTGCITCKRRHVKCDESKPGCQRCIKWRGHCDGYEDGRTKSRTPESGKKKTQTSPTTPTTGEQEKVKLPRWYRALAAESSKLLIRPDDVCANANLKGLDERKNSAITESKDDDSRSGISGFDDTFWKAAVPYLLRQNEAVWYAHLAIHALVDAKKPSWNNDVGGGGGGTGGNDHGSGGSAKASYRRALRYHGLALGQLRKEAINRDSLQSATLCCLFFVIFEMMNGDDKAAQAHMYNGCKMLDELQRDSQSGAMSNAQVDAMLHRELQKALRFVAIQINGASQSQDSISQPSLPPSPLAMTMSSEGIASEATSGDEWYGFGL